MIKPTIFRDYDIRGIAGKDFEEQDFEILGRTFGTYIQKISGKNVLIGRDNRFSSDSTAAYFVQGLLSTGCNVVDTGLSLRPIIQLGIFKEHFDGGAIITASHNPPEYNGTKFLTREGLPIFAEQIQDLKNLFYSKGFITGKGVIDYSDISELYFENILSKFDLSNGLKVVVDCGNGTASQFAPKLFHKLGYEVVSIHCNLMGNYPFHIPNPEARVNTLDLAHKVKEVGADIGLAFDTDGDRYGVIDEQGNFYEADRTLIILAQDVLREHPGGKIIFDIKSSRVLETEIKKAGGVPMMLRTGHPYFMKMMREDPDIVLGGELSGHTMFQENNCFDDGLFAAAKVLSVLARSGKKYSELYQDIPVTAYTPEIKATCPDEEKFAIVDQIKDAYRNRYPINEIDGVRISFSENDWALIRASNTTPCLSLRFEADYREELQKIMNDVRSELEKYPQVDLTQLNFFLESGMKR